MDNTAIHEKLIYASENGDTDAVRSLLLEGASVDFKDREGRTALMAATQKNQISAVKLLLDAGSDVNTRDITMLTPFICAGANGFHEILSLMLSYEPDLGKVNRFGGTALLPSSEKGYLKTVQRCLDAGIPVNHANNLGWSGLLEAVILGNGGRLYSLIAELLVKAGADPHLKDRDGKSSLEHAKDFGQEKVYSILAGTFKEEDSIVEQAKALYLEDRYEEAIALLDKGLADNPENRDYYFYKGYCLQELKRYEEALGEYNKALALEPSDLDFYFYTANCLRLMKRVEEALAEYKKAVEMAPGETFYRYHQSNYLRELGRHEEAVCEMDQLLALQPNRYDFSFHKANSLRSLGKHREAIEAIENAIANDPENPLYHMHKQQSLELLTKQENQ